MPLLSPGDSVLSTIAIIVLAVIALLAIIIAFFIIRRINQNLKKITAAAEKISSGELKQNVEVTGNNETGKLGQAFNKMSSDIREMMEASSDEKGRLLTIISAISDGVIMTDYKGNILLVNPASENLFNFKADNVIGKPLIEVMFNYEIDDILNNCLKYRQKQDTRIETTSGKLIRVIAVPLKVETMSGAALLFQDLTELRSLQAMRREFIGNISHELRSPLAAIKAIAETLQDGAINDKDTANDFLNKINSEVDSMTHLVNKLIELSRVETGKTRLNLEPVNLNQSINEVVGHLLPQMERKQISLTLDLTDGIPLVQADRERIQQVITNIIHNAVKFTPGGGEITIKSTFSNTAVTVQVSDTGIGISGDDLPHIFERFFKADKSRTAEGSGLGLAIAKHIIQAHGGKIWVQSREGKGAVFNFSIPLPDTRNV